LPAVTAPSAYRMNVPIHLHATEHARIHPHIVRKCTYVKGSRAPVGQRLGLRWVSPDIGQYQLLGNSSDYSAIANSPFGTISVIKAAVALHLFGTDSQAIRPGLEKRKRVRHGATHHG
jgi:hypothetical protein